jgi:transposase-like protein
MANGIGGVSTRRVDELAQALGLSGLSKSTVSKLCKDIDERVNEFLNRPLTGDWPVRRGARTGGAPAPHSGSTPPT